MSDGKKFAAKAVESAEERLTEIERKYSVIQERIQAYDAVLSEFSAIKAELRSNRKTIETFVSASGSVFDELRSKIDTSSAQFQILHAKAESNVKAIEDLKNYVGKFVSNNNKIYQDFNEVVSKIKEQGAYAVEESKKSNSFAFQAQLMFQDLKKAHDVLKNSLQKLTDAHIQLKDATEASQADTSKQHTKLKQAIASLPNVQEWATSLYAKLQDNLAYRDKQATSYVDAQVQKLAKDFDANPLSAESVKAALFNEMQTLALDGKNAYLKSNNVSQQLAVVEKKLENLNLLIKRYELNK